MSDTTDTTSVAQLAVEVGQTAVASDGVFYACIHNIADDNTYRITLIFASRDVADQWWRAVSTSTIALLQSVKRITPQFYTHDIRIWNVYTFFTDARITAISAQFRGKFFFVLENDRVGRGISIIPPQTIVDYTSGNWFTIRSRSNPNNYWFYDQSKGFVVSSSTHRTSFQVTAPDAVVGTVMIGTDDIVIRALNHGYVNPGDSNAAGGNFLHAAGESSNVAFRYKFSDLKSGVFVASGTAVLYVHGTVGAGSSWELWQ